MFRRDVACNVSTVSLEMTSLYIGLFEASAPVPSPSPKGVWVEHTNRRDDYAGALKGGVHPINYIGLFEASVAVLRFLDHAGALKEECTLRP